MSEKIALLIDAENTSVKYIDAVLKELKQYGNISVQRMYGDFSSEKMKEWAKRGLEYAIVPIHQSRYTATKNASDIMLVIDAMDILFRGVADIFCIVTSDSDFTRLASRLREGGKRVIGMGMSNASKTFITACNEYKFLDKIIDEETEEEIEEEIVEDSAVTPISEVKKAINNMLQQAENDGMLLNMGSTKSRLQREFSDFDERNYGYTSFRKMIEVETKFRVVIEKNSAYILREKQAATKADEASVVNYIKTRAKKNVELGKLGNEIHNSFPEFKYKELGYSKLSKYIQGIPGVDVVNKKNKQHVMLSDK